MKTLAIVLFFAAIVLFALYPLQNFILDVIYFGAKIQGY